MTSLPQSVEATAALLADGGYIADEATTTAVFLSLKLQRPLLLEGDAGVGKTEIAKVLSEQLGRSLVRLQCYEGLDTSNALYEWNYQKQLLPRQIVGGWSLGLYRTLRIKKSASPHIVECAGSLVQTGLLAVNGTLGQD